MILILSLAAVTVSAATLIIILNRNNNEYNKLSQTIRTELAVQQSSMRQEISAQTQSSVKNLGDLLIENQRSNSESQSERLEMLERRMDRLTFTTEHKLDNIREAMDKRLDGIQKDNNRKLDEMRLTVDEKLEKSLEERINRSFSLVNERLEQVHKGLGEMQTLAVGVGDLKKVLSNVKTRGILGEIQLGSILREILSPGQYDENAVTKKGTKNVVEFAVKLPADGEGFIYLPIDSKFPGDAFAALRDAQESGDRERAQQAAKQLVSVIKSEAKDIRDKYIDPPNTTDFAVMFLPF